MTRPLTLLIILILTLLGKLPLRFRRFLGKNLGTLAYHISSRESQISTLQLKKILKQNSEQSVQTTKKIYQNLAINFLEIINLKPILKNPNLHFEINQPALLKKYATDDYPVILLSAHTGNWELLAAYLIKTSHPLIAIGKPMRSKVIQNLLEWLRSQYSVTTAWRGSISGTKELTRNLKNGATLGGLIDQDLSLIHI